MGIPLAADTVFYVLPFGVGVGGQGRRSSVEFVNKRESIVRPFPNN